MAFADPLVLNDGQGSPVAHNFALLAEGKRVDPATLAPLSLTAAIKHAQQGTSKDASIADRRLLQVVYSELDALGRPQFIISNHTVTIWRGISAATMRPRINDVLAYDRNFFNVVGNVDKWLTGQQ